MTATRRQRCRAAPRPTWSRSPSTASRSPCPRARWSSGPPSRSASRSRGSATTRCSTRSAPAASAWSTSRASASRWPPAPPVADGMVVKTQLTSPVADKAQHGVMELLLINHPLDCPICDKGGECPLQNQAMSNGRGETRFDEHQADLHKPINDLAQVLLDRERCVLCAAAPASPSRSPATRSSTLHRARRPSSRSRIDRRGEPFESYFSGNTVQICPVGALTGAAYRFRSRPFDLVSTPSVVRALRVRLRACAPTTAAARSLRRLAGNDPQVNEEWNCDKGRWAFTLRHQPPTGIDHPAGPRREDRRAARRRPGRRRSRSRPQRAAAERRRPPASACWPAAGSPLEDAYAYAKFARVALGTNDIDFRARPHSAEEAQFLARTWSARPRRPVTLRRPGDRADRLLAGFEPEEESPIVFLRLRKAARASADQGVLDRAVRHPRAGQAARHAAATARARRPGAALRPIAGSTDRGRRPSAARPGAVILVGERLAGLPGALSAAAPAGRGTGARLAWIPRRAGERGAVEAGACPACCPADARSPTRGPRPRSPRLGRRGLPAEPGRDTDEILAAAAAGELGALVVGGVDPADLPDPAAALAALDAAPFVVSLELRAQRGDRPRRRGAPGRAGGREGRHVRRLGGPGAPVRRRRCPMHRRSADRPARARRAGRRDGRAPRPAATRGGAAAELDRLGAAGTAPRAAPVAAAPSPAARREPGEAVLATWHLLLDNGRLQDGEPYLAGTATPAGRPAVRGHRGRASASPTAIWSPSPTDARRDHPAAGDRRHARPGGLAADQLARARASARDLALAAGTSPAADSLESPEHDDRLSAACAPRPTPDAADLGSFGHDIVVAHPDQGRRDLRVPGAADAVHIWSERTRRRPDAAAHRPEPGRARRAAAVAGRRRQAGPQGRHHPEGGRQAGLHPGPDDLRRSRPSSPSR